MPRGSDLTQKAVLRQISGMGGDQFEMGILDQSTGRMLLRQWSAAEIIKSIPWLRHQNYVDANIFVRPFGASSLILLDDILLGTLKILEADGLTPTVVVETSSLNFQAWVKLSEKPVSNECRTLIAKALAKKYNADPASADWRHFGRLAGFTNRKPNRRGEDGRPPFVKLYSVTGKVAPHGETFLKELESQSVKREIRFYREKPILNADLEDPIQFFLSHILRLMDQYKQEFDASSSDWSGVSRMLNVGYTRDQIETALAASPNLETRKKGHVQNYIQRTIRKLYVETEEVILVNED